MMSDQAERCYQKYLRNVALAQALDEQFQDDDGWSIVIRFYAALQLINAYLLDKKNVVLKLDDTGHEQRKAAMARCPELREAPLKYRTLKALSEGVRYDTAFQFAPHHREAAKNLFAKIVAIVEPKLKKA
jgi:hypothetical protein